MSQEEKCAMKIENLYRILRGEITPGPSFVIKDILDTEKCQEWHNLAMIREATAKQLRKHRPNALDSDVACFDDKVCSDIVAEYSTWYRKAVRRELPFRARAHYWRKDSADEIGWAFTIVSAFAGGAVFGRVGGVVSGVVVKSMSKSLVDNNNNTS